MSNCIIESLIVKGRNKGFQGWGRIASIFDVFISLPPLPLLEVAAHRVDNPVKQTSVLHHPN